MGWNKRKKLGINGRNFQESARSTHYRLDWDDSLTVSRVARKIIKTSYPPFTSEDSIFLRFLFKWKKSKKCNDSSWTAWAGPVCLFSSGYRTLSPASSNKLGSIQYRYKKRKFLCISSVLYKRFELEPSDNDKKNNNKYFQPYYLQIKFKENNSLSLKVYLYLPFISAHLADHNLIFFHELLKSEWSIISSVMSLIFSDVPIRPPV